MTRMSSTTDTTTTTAAEGKVLTFEEARAINIRYERRKRDATIPDALLVGGGGGDVDGAEDDDDRKKKPETTTTTISRDEARRIMDYAIEEDRRSELRDLRARRRGELLAGWEERGARADNGDDNNDSNDHHPYDNDILIPPIK